MEMKYRYSVTLPDGTELKFTASRKNQKFAVLRRIEEFNGGAPTMGAWALDKSYSTKSSAKQYMEWDMKSEAYVGNPNHAQYALNQHTLGQPNWRYNRHPFDLLLLPVTYHPRQSAVLWVRRDPTLASGWGEWESADPAYFETVDTSEWTFAMWERVKWGHNPDVASHFITKKHDILENHQYEWHNGRCKDCGLKPSEMPATHTVTTTVRL